MYYTYKEGERERCYIIYIYILLDYIHTCISWELEARNRGYTHIYSIWYVCVPLHFSLRAPLRIRSWHACIVCLPFSSNPFLSLFFSSLFLRNGLMMIRAMGPPASNAVRSSPVDLHQWWTCDRGIHKRSEDNRSGGKQFPSRCFKMGWNWFQLLGLEIQVSTPTQLKITINYVFGLAKRQKNKPLFKWLQTFIRASVTNGLKHMLK